MKRTIALFSRFQIVLVFVLLFVALTGGLSVTAVLGSNLKNQFVCNGQLMTEVQLAEYRGISLEFAQGIHASGFLRFAELCKASQAELEQAIVNLENAGEASDFRRMQLQDENGKIPTDAYENALEKLDKMRVQQSVSLASAGIDSGAWNWVGPGNIGGRVRALVVHPTNKNIMWVGGISGGIWKTTNGGKSWQTQDDFMVSMAVTSIVINPQHPEILYAGTGEGIGDSETASRWIFRTDDSGSTWTQLDVVADANYVHGLAISHDGSTLLAATDDGVLRCTEAYSGGIVSNRCQDISDWSSVYANQPPQNNQVFDIEFSPTDSLLAIAGGEGGLVLYSDDGGASWTSVNLVSGEVVAGRVELAYGSGGVAYASTTNEYQGDSIYKSINNGESYTLQSSGHSYLDGNSSNKSMLWVDPSDSTKIVVGGTNIYRSTNSGTTLTRISDGTQAPNSAFSGQHIAVSGSGNQVIFGTDGGIYRVDDIDTVTETIGWTGLNNNLGITEFYSVALTTGGDIVGGTRGTGTIRHAEGANTEAWTVVEDGEGGFVVADSANDNLIYGSFSYLKIFRNNNGTLTDISGSIGGVGHTNVVAPFIIDPYDSNQILAGGDKLWRADNVDTSNNPTWNVLHDYSSTGSNISAIAVGSASNDIWVGLNNGNIYRDISTLADTGLPNRQITRIIVDGSTIYVTLGGFAKDNIWKTVNDGASWTQVGVLPIVMPVYDLVVRPSYPNHLYIGTEFGVFVTENANLGLSATWSTGSNVDGPTSSSVQDLYLDGNTLIAATYGRGVFTAEIGSSQPDNDDFDNPTVIPAPISLPFQATQDTSSATQAGDDPAIADCGMAPGPATVWYQYTPDETEVTGGKIAIAINTKGSKDGVNGYDTYLAVWEGDRGNLTPIACNNDISVNDSDSEIGVSLTQDVTYYLEVGQYNGNLSGTSAPVGGNLVLSIDNEVYSISGTVTEGNGTPVAGANVRVHTGMSTISAWDGTYTLYPVPDGNIKITVEASGYNSISRIINVSGNVSGENFILDLGFEDPATKWSSNAFDYNHGWRVDQHPRMFADVDGDGDDDAVGFGLDGIYVALSDGNSISDVATKWSSNAFDYNHGWRVDQHPRMFADVDGDGDDDAVGFGLDGIYVALSDGSSISDTATRWSSNAFDYNHGWRVDQHPRMFADVDGDGDDDAVGFGLDGIYVAISDGSSIADSATKWTSAFDYNHGWRVDSHPRMFADVNGDGKADAVGFGLDGIYVALSNGGSFAATATKWTSAFDYNHGWRVDSHPRMLADVNGDGKADAIGFGLDGVYVAISNGSNFEANASRWTTAFDYNHGWRVDGHPRMLADVNGDIRADVCGFGLDGIYVALAE